MKQKVTIIIIMAIVSGSGFLVVHGQTTKRGKKALLRIGVYDSRIITIAYSDSMYNDNIMVKKSKEKKEAEKAGDLEKVQKIDDWMNWFSIYRHAQGFSTEPVHDLLACVQKKIPQIAREAGVDIIVSKWEFDYIASDAEVVDVTEQLALLFEPKSEISPVIQKLKDTKPVPYTEIVRHEMEGGH